MQLTRYDGFNEGVLVGELHGVSLDVDAEDEGLFFLYIFSYSEAPIDSISTKPITTSAPTPDNAPSSSMTIDTLNSVPSFRISSSLPRAQLRIIFSSTQSFFSHQPPLSFIRFSVLFGLSDGVPTTLSPQLNYEFTDFILSFYSHELLLKSTFRLYHDKETHTVWSPYRPLVTSTLNALLYQYEPRGRSLLE